jgi:hypothetical protein
LWRITWTLESAQPRRAGVLRREGQPLTVQLEDDLLHPDAGGVRAEPKIRPPALKGGGSEVEDRREKRLRPAYALHLGLQFSECSAVLSHDERNDPDPQQRQGRWFWNFAAWGRIKGDDRKITDS